MNQENLEIFNQIETIKNEVALTLAKTINLYGFSLSEARLFSIMFFEEDPMTLDEMSQALGMSKTSMSTGVRSLLDAKMVERTWQKGIRKDLYMAQDNLYKTFSNTFIEKWDSMIYYNKRICNRISRQLNLLLEQTDDPELQIILSQYSTKIDSIINFYKWLGELFDEIQEKIDDIQK